MRRLWLAALIVVAGARADVDVSEYESKSALSSLRDQRRIQREIAQEQAAELWRADEAAKRQARQRTEEESARAARPYGERLLEARCTVCHGAENYRGTRHGTLGWWLVVLRIRHMNGAYLEPGEPGAIVAELMRVRGPSWADRVLEYGVLAGALAAVPLLVWGGRRVLRLVRRRESQ